MLFFRLAPLFCFNSVQRHQSTKNSHITKELVFKVSPLDFHMRCERTTLYKRKISFSFYTFKCLYPKGNNRPVPSRPVPTPISALPRAPKINR